MHALLFEISLPPGRDQSSRPAHPLPEAGATPNFAAHLAMRGPSAEGPGAAPRLATELTGPPPWAGGPHPAPDADADADAEVEVEVEAATEAEDENAAGAAVADGAGPRPSHSLASAAGTEPATPPGAGAWLPGGKAGAATGIGPAVADGPGSAPTEPRPEVTGKTETAVQHPALRTGKTGLPPFRPGPQEHTDNGRNALPPEAGAKTSEYVSASRAVPDGQAASADRNAIEAQPKGAAGVAEVLRDIALPESRSTEPALSDTPRTSAELRGTGTGLRLSGPAPAPAATRLAEGFVRLAAGAGGSVEIALDPPELGRVRLTLAPGGSDSGLSVTVTAERPEALDLLRRQAGDLARELRALGYDSLSLAFTGEGDRPPKRGEGPAGSPTGLVPEQAGTSAAVVLPTSAVVTAGLDLRL